MAPWPGQRHCLAGGGEGTRGGGGGCWKGCGREEKRRGATAPLPGRWGEGEGEGGGGCGMEGKGGRGVWVWSGRNRGEGGWC